MSTYSRQTKHPFTNEWHEATWIDDFYGRHNYGVQFPGGDTYDPRKFPIMARDSKPNTLTSTEKRLEEFNENFGHMDEDFDEYFRRLQSFLTESITQAIAEERARMRAEIEKIRKSYLGSENYLSEDGKIAQRVFEDIIDLLSSLDKLTANKE